MAVVLALRKQRQEECEVKAGLSITARHCLYDGNDDGGGHDDIDGGDGNSKIVMMVVVMVKVMMEMTVTIPKDPR